MAIGMNEGGGKRRETGRHQKNEAQPSSSPRRAEGSVTGTGSLYDLPHVYQAQAQEAAERLQNLKNSDKILTPLSKIFRDSDRYDFGAVKALISVVAKSRAIWGDALDSEPDQQEVLLNWLAHLDNDRLDQIVDLVKEYRRLRVLPRAEQRQLWQDSYEFLLATEDLSDTERSEVVNDAAQLNQLSHRAQQAAKAEQETERLFSLFAAE